MLRIGEKEKAYVMEVLEEQFRTSRSGRMTALLERRFAETFNSGYAISFVNGTATMHAALAAMGVGPGDEVIVPPLTMSSTSLAVLHAGATPVFADIDPHTWTVDPEAVRRCVTARTRAIIPVALYGLPPDMPAIMAIASEQGLGVIEDDAQCFLGSIDGRVAGSMAHASSFSFQSSKHMTSGEGGMVTTSDAGLAERIRRFANLGYGAVAAQAGGSKIPREAIQSPAYDRHLSIGWNYRMPDLCAAVALAQLERLEELVEQRRAAADILRQAAAECRWLVPQHVPNGYRHAYWCFTVRLDHGGRFTWHDFRTRFLEFGGDPFYAAWKLTYLEPAFHRKTLTPQQTCTYCEGLCPVAESLQPALIQFKTNYFDLDRARAQGEALRRTTAYFDRFSRTSVPI